MWPSCAPGRLARGATGPERLLVRGVVSVGAERMVPVWQDGAWAQGPACSGGAAPRWRPPAFPRGQLGVQCRETWASLKWVVKRWCGCGFGPQVPCERLPFASGSWAHLGADPKPALALRAVQGGAGGSLSHSWLGRSVCLHRGSVGQEGAETLLPRSPATLRTSGGLGSLGGLCFGPRGSLLLGVSVMPAR